MLPGTVDLSKNVGCGAFWWYITVIEKSLYISVYLIPVRRDLYVHYFPDLGLCFLRLEDIYDNVTHTHTQRKKSNKVLLFSDRCLCPCSHSEGRYVGSGAFSLPAPWSWQPARTWNTCFQLCWFQVTPNTGGLQKYPVKIHELLSHWRLELDDI